jgi:hypothetical protein
VRLWMDLRPAARARARGRGAFTRLFARCRALRPTGGFNRTSTSVHCIRTAVLLPGPSPRFVVSGICISTLRRAGELSTRRCSAQALFAFTCIRDVICTGHGLLWPRPCPGRTPIASYPTDTAALLLHLLPTYSCNITADAVVHPGRRFRVYPPPPPRADLRICMYDGYPAATVCVSRGEPIGRRVCLGPARCFCSCVEHMARRGLWPSTRRGVGLLRRRVSSSALWHWI